MLPQVFHVHLHHSCYFTHIMQYKIMQNRIKSTIQYKPSCRTCWRFCPNLLCRRFAIHFTIVIYFSHGKLQSQKLDRRLHVLEMQSYTSLSSAARLSATLPSSFAKKNNISCTGSQSNYELDWLLLVKFMCEYRKTSDRSRAPDRRRAPHTGRGSDSLVPIEAGPR